MGIMDGFKARKELMNHQRGKTAEAREAYEQLYAAGYLSAAYMLETEADHSPLVRDLMKNGYAVRDFGSYRVYYRESGVS